MRSSPIEIIQEVGYLLGYGKNYHNWTFRQFSDVFGCIDNTPKDLIRK